MNKFFKVDDQTIGINYKLHSKYITCLFDLEDLELIKQYNLQICTNGYVQCRKKGEKGEYLMVHNIIMKPPEGKEVDHIKGNRSDNRKSQLRFLTHQQNSQSRHKSNGCPGVYLDNKLKRHYVQIKVNGKNRHIGMRKEYREAVDLRNKVVKEYYGEFARMY